jgi:hypothetical protein
MANAIQWYKGGVLWRNGGMAFNAACCCKTYTPGSPCPYCSGGTPRSYAVTFSGISVCSPCYGFTSERYAWIDAPDLNGSFQIDQTGDWLNCEWQRIDEGNYGMVRWWHLDPDCTGEYVSIPMTSRAIRLLNINIPVLEYVFEGCTEGLYPDCFTAIAFRCEGDVWDRCAEGLVLGNEAGCSLGDSATGGQAVLEPV